MKPLNLETCARRVFLCEAHSMDNLPVEILTLVLSFSDPFTLRQAPLVCHLWNDILRDDTVWMQMYHMIYPYHDFISITNDTYRHELIKRSEMIRTYQKDPNTVNGYFLGTGGTNLNNVMATIGLPIRSSNHLLVDWSKQKIFSLDIPNDCLLFCDMRKGKNFQNVYDFTPEGVTCYDWNIKYVSFGRWDGSIGIGQIGVKGLVLTKINIHKLGGTQKINCLHTCHFNGIGDMVLSIDDAGLIKLWDIKNEKIVWSFELELPPTTSLSFKKVHSNCKDKVLVVLSTGEIYCIDTNFKDSHEGEVKLIGKVNPDTFDNQKLVIDYGGQGVIVWNENELLIYNLNTRTISGSTDNLHDHQSELLRKFTPPLGKLIIKFVIPESFNLLSARNLETIGNEPLIIAVCLNDGQIVILNARDTQWEMRPITTITPRFLNEKDAHLVEIRDDRVSQVASLAINGTVCIVANHLGKVEIFDLMNGKFLRIAINKLTNNRLNQLKHFITEQGGNILKIDQNHPRGLLIIGPYVQYFCLGEDTPDINKRKKNIKGNKNKSKGDLNSIRLNFDDYHYQLEQEELKNAEQRDIIEKFGVGSSATDLDGEVDEEMQLAMAMSLSEQQEQPVAISDDESYEDHRNLIEKLPEDDDEEEALLRSVMEMSLREAQQQQQFDEQEWQHLT